MIVLTLCSFFFNDTPTTEIYTYSHLFPYTTLFRSPPRLVDRQDGSVQAVRRPRLQPHGQRRGLPPHRPASTRRFNQGADRAGDCLALPGGRGLRLVNSVPSVDTRPGRKSYRSQFGESVTSHFRAAACILATSVPKAPHSSKTRSSRSADSKQTHPWYKSEQP